MAKDPHLPVLTPLYTPWNPPQVFLLVSWTNQPVPTCQYCGPPAPAFKLSGTEGPANVKLQLPKTPWARTAQPSSSRIPGSQEQWVDGKLNCNPTRWLQITPNLSTVTIPYHPLCYWQCWPLRCVCSAALSVNLIPAARTAVWCARAPRSLISTHWRMTHDKSDSKKQSYFASDLARVTLPAAQGSMRQPW